MMVIVLVLGSALLHASWNALLRVEPDKRAAMVAVVLVSALASTLAAIAQTAAGTAAFPQPEAIVWSIVAGALEAGYFAALVRALGGGALGPVYTVSRGGALLLVWPLSIALLGEPLTGIDLAGSVVVIAGLAAVGSATGSTTTTTRGALLWAIVTALFIAGYHLAYKAATTSHGSPTATFAVAMITASALNLIRIGSDGRRATLDALRQRGPRLALTGTLCAAGFLLFIIALGHGGAGYVLTLRNTSVLFATALGWAIGEPPSRRQLLGAALVVAGAVLLGLGH